MEKKEERRDFLVVIPARGGSKGIPMKNIKELGGKPLIHYAIENALSIAGPEDICVSTDSQRIADVAKLKGVDIPFLRPEELASDTSSSRDVLLHALDFYQQRGLHYDYIVLLQPTSPFLSPLHIREALALRRPGIDMIVSVKEADTNPYYNAWETDSSGKLRISKGDGKFTRRQDAPKVWQYNGALYIINAESLRQGWFSDFESIVPYAMSREDSIDLDTPLDWLVAEEMLKNRLEG